MAKNNNLTDFLTDIANTIRATDGTATTPLTDANKIDPQNFSSRIVNYQNKTVTPSATEQAITKDTGYMALGTVTVKANSEGPKATVTSGTSYSSVSKNISYNSTNSNFDVTLSGTVSAPTVGTAGYISSSAGTRNTSTATGTTTLPLIGITATQSGTAKVTPTIGTLPSPVSSKSQIAITPTTNTSDINYYYAAVYVPSNSSTLTISANVSSAGYGDSSHSSITGTTVSVGNNSSSVYYIPLASASVSVSGGGLSKGTASGGGLSGGGLSKGSGEVSITQNPEITPSVTRNYTVSGATDSTYGVTTTKPTSGNYATFNPEATVDKEAKAKGRGSVTRAAVTRAAFSQTVTRAQVNDTRTAGWLPSRDSTKIIDSASETVSLGADSTTIGQATETSNYSSESSSTTTVKEGTNVYIPVASATATGGTASASASIAKQPNATATGGTATASASQTGMTAGVSDTATSYYFTSSASATGGSASAASGYSTASASATGGSASVSKGITAGASASGASSGNKSATSTEVTKSATGTSASDSSTIYLKAATGSVTGSNLTGTNDVSIYPIDGSNAGVNISGIVGTKATSEPTSGYYLAFTGSSSATAQTQTAKITTAGYTPTNDSFATRSVSYSATSATKYFPIAAAEFEVSGASVKTKASKAGYVPANTTVGTVASGTSSVVGSLPEGATSTDVNYGYYVKIGAGYYNQDKYYKSTATTLTFPTTTASSAAQYYSSIASVTPSTADQYLNLPVGYNTSGKYYKINAVATGTATGNAGTITYVSHTQDSTNKKKFTVTGSVSAPAPTVSAGYISSGTAGSATNRTVSLTITDAQAQAAVGTGSATTPATTITANPSTPVFNPETLKFDITVSKTQDVTPTVSAGYVSTGTAGTITVSGSSSLNMSQFGTTTDTPSSYTTLTLGGVYKLTSGYYNGDRYYKVPAGPSGNIELTKATSTDVSAYATATVRSASTFTMTGSDVTDVVTVGTLSSGYYPISAKVKGTIAAGTSGWFSSSGAVQAGTATKVGKIAAGTITNNTSGGTSSGTINAGSQIKIGKGYYSADQYYQAAAQTSLAGDAAVGDVLTGKTFYSNSYTKQTGTMTNNGAVSATLDTSTTSYTVPAGYHNGSGKVSITLETKAASAAGDITPTSGKVLSKVTVGSGSATPSATVTGSSSALSSTTAMNNQYFSVTPKASVGTAGWISSISDGSAINYKIKDGEATPSATYATLSSAGTTPTSVASQYFKITPTASVTTAGWINSINDGTVQNYTVRSASTFTMTGSDVTDEVTVGTVASGYYPVSAKVKGTITAGTAGWFTNSGAVQAGTATQVGKIAAGSVAIDDKSLSVSPSVTPTATVSATGSSITLGTKTTTQPTSGRYISVVGGNSATTGSATSGESATVTKTTGYITEGTETITSTATATAAANSTTAYYPIDSSSVSVSDSSLSVSPSVTPTAVASATGNISLTAASSQPSSGYYIKATGGNSATTGSSTAGESSTITWTKGYTDASTSSTQKTVSSTATATANASSKDQYYTIPTATWGTATAPQGTTPTELAAGTTYKLAAGYYNSDRYYKTLGGPTGNIELTQSTSTNVAAYATATVRAGAATPSASYATLSSAGTSPTSVTSQYFKITPTASVGTAGWISSINNGTVQNYTVRSQSGSSGSNTLYAGHATLSDTNTSGISISASSGGYTVSTSGWISTGTYGSAIFGPKYIDNLFVKPDKTLTVYIGAEDETGGELNVPCNYGIIKIYNEYYPDFPIVDMQECAISIPYGDSLDDPSYITVTDLNGLLNQINLPTSTSSTTASGSSVANITPGTWDQYLNLPEGYNVSKRYYTIKAVSNHSGSASSTTSGTISIDDSHKANVTFTSTNNGIYVEPSASGVSRNYSVSTAGWIATGTYGDTSGSLTGSKYYINKITVPQDVPFAVDMKDDTAYDTTSYLTINNNTYRRISITNVSNSTVGVTSSSSNGTVNVTQVNSINLGYNITGSTVQQSLTVPSLSIYSYNSSYKTTVTTLTNSANSVIGTYSGSGTIGTYTNTGTITNMTGSRTITTLGRSGSSGTLTISNNGYNASNKGTVNIITNTYGEVRIGGNTETGSNIYFKALEGTIPSRKTVTSLANNGSITTLSGTGSISTYSNTGSISYMTGTRTINYLGNSSNNGQININYLGYSSSHQGTINILESKYGDVKIQSANPSSSANPTWTYSSPMVSLADGASGSTFRYLWFKVASKNGRYLAAYKTSIGGGAGYYTDTFSNSTHTYLFDIRLQPVCILI